MKAVTGDKLSPGDVVVRARRVGLVLGRNADGDVEVLTSKGAQTWPAKECRPGDSRNSKAVTWAVRALDQAKAAEAKATTDLESLRRLDRVQRERIQRVAHAQAERHSLGSGLDDLLESHGLARRPVMFQQVLAVHVRYTYVGGTGVGRTFPLDFDEYATLGAIPPRAVIDRFRTLTMPPAAQSFDHVDRCTCETERPEPDAVRRQWDGSVGAQRNWRTDLVGYTVLYASDSRRGVNCRHVHTHRRTWDEVMPGAPSLPEMLVGAHDPAPAPRTDPWRTLAEATMTTGAAFTAFPEWVSGTGTITITA